MIRSLLTSTSLLFTATVFSGTVCSFAQNTIAVAGTTSGLFLSCDRGTSWHKAEALGTSTVFAVAIDKRDSKHLCAAGFKQLFMTDDGGRNWSSAALPTNAPVERLFVSGEWIFVLSKHVAWMSSDRGQHWDIQHGIPEQIVDLAVDGAEEPNLYATTRTGLYMKRGTSSWMLVPPLIREGGIRADPALPGRLVRYRSTDFSRSVDGGYTWSSLSPIEAQLGPAFLGATIWGDLPLSLTLSVADVAAGARDTDVIVYGTVCVNWDGDDLGCGTGILLNRDGYWTAIPLSRGGTPLTLAVDRASGATLAGGAPGELSGLLRSIDGGLSWSGLPDFSMVTVNAVAISTELRTSSD